VDLAIQVVEIRRTTSGVKLKATIKNRSRRACSSKIYLQVENLAPGGRSAVVAEPVSTGIEGLEEITMFRWLHIAAPEKGGSRYRVTVKTDGCPESELFNNTCHPSPRLRKGEDKAICPCSVYFSD
jgi:hypothetical protein